MGAATRFHANQTWRQLGEIPQDLAAFKLFTQYGFFLVVDTVKLKNLLCQIYSYFV